MMNYKEWEACFTIFAKYNPTGNGMECDMDCMTVKMPYPSIMEPEDITFLQSVGWVWIDVKRSWEFDFWLNCED